MMIDIDVKKYEEEKDERWRRIVSKTSASSQLSMNVLLLAIPVPILALRLLGVYIPHFCPTKTQQFGF
jgi:hypothetical protein